MPSDRANAEENTHPQLTPLCPPPQGVAEEDVLAISAATGRGVTDLVRRVRIVLDALPEGAEESEDEEEFLADGGGDEGGAAGARVLTARRNAARIGEFSITPDLRGPRVWFVEVRLSSGGGVLRVCRGVFERLLGCTQAEPSCPAPPPLSNHPSPQGDAIERFAQMTDWGYYEAARRFQQVLKASGINAALLAQGVREGDSVVIGEVEFVYSEDQSEQALFSKWYQDRRANGIVGRGQARWPHTSG